MKTINMAIVALLLFVPVAFVTAENTDYWVPNATPGSDGAIMKTLDEIEPRIPIHTLPFTITNPGVYYLAGHLTGVPNDYGIKVLCNDVQLDLNGFALNGRTNSLSGILLTNGAENVTIRHGVVRNWGWHGVDGYWAKDSVFEDLKVYENGGGGILTDQNCLVSKCVTYGNGWSTSSSIWMKDGINAWNYCSITDCKSRANYGTGIYAGDGSTVEGCTAAENRDKGIHTGEYCTIRDCLAVRNGTDGIQVYSKCRVVDNNASDNGYGYWDEITTNWVDMAGAGIMLYGNANRIEDNNVCNNDVGISVNSSYSGNLIIRNSASWNTVNFSVGQYDYFGQVLDSSSLYGYSTGFGDTNPWSNFAF